jgi:hypothetical protein
MESVAVPPPHDRATRGLDFPHFAPKRDGGQTFRPAASEGVLLRRRHLHRRRARAAAIARELGKLGVTWSCNAKANVPRELLKTMRDNGLRLLLVGYESGNQQILHNIKKGVRIDVARQFSKNCHELGIVIHGAFILGLPGDTKETIEETIRFACEVDPHTLQVSIAHLIPAHIFIGRRLRMDGWTKRMRT